jgi:predicted Fe-Mo cluster-binding NifX family protein
VGKEVRHNNFTAHARGECLGETQHGHQAHSHTSVVEALSDCGAVICGGMGARAADAFSQQGIQPYVLREGCTPEAAIALFVEGRLGAAGQSFCQCHGS